MDPSKHSEGRREVTSGGGREEEDKSPTKERTAALTVEDEYGQETKQLQSTMF